MGLQNALLKAPAAMPVPAGPIDMEHLSNQALGDENLALEVLRLFDDMSRTYFARLAASTTAAQALEHLHTLRGAASGIGAFSLAELAKAAETGLRAGEKVNLERIDDIGIAVEEVSAFIAGQVKAAA